jgi:hypothetical protein
MARGSSGTRRPGHMSENAGIGPAARITRKRERCARA